MRVQDVMSDHVRAISPAVPADDAWVLMRNLAIHHLVVMDGSTIVGIISDRDIGSQRNKNVRRNRTVGELMTPRVVTVPVDATLRRAANLMRGRSIGSLVVTDRGRVKGIITVTDLLDVLGRGVARPAKVGRNARVPGNVSRRQFPAHPARRAGRPASGGQRW